MAEANLQSHDDAQQIEMFEGVSRRTLNHGDQTSIHEIVIAKGGVVKILDFGLAKLHPHIRRRTDRAARRSPSCPSLI